MFSCTQQTEAERQIENENSNNGVIRITDVGENAHLWTTGAQTESMVA